MKRTRLNARGKGEVSVLKEQIQALLRSIVIARDGGCILRHIRHCSEDAVLQADHLITRSNSATYADHRLVVCVCKPCHYWKSVAGNLRKEEYDELVRGLLDRERVDLWDKCKFKSWQPVSKRAYDWQMEIVALKQQLQKYE